MLPCAVYLTNCVSLSMRHLPQLDEAIRLQRPIRLATFRRAIERSGWERLQRQLGYAVGAECGLHIARDFHVRYARTTFCGRRAWLLVHSAIEYIFLEPADAAHARDVVFGAGPVESEQ